MMIFQNLAVTWKRSPQTPVCMPPTSGGQTFIKSEPRARKGLSCAACAEWLHCGQGDDCGAGAGGGQWCQGED